MNIRANIAYGLLVLVPIGLAVVAVKQVAEVLNAIAVPLARTFGLDTNALVGATGVIAGAVALLVASFLVGSAVRTRLGSWSFEKFEDRLLKVIPGYKIVGNILKGFAGEEVAQYHAATIDLYGGGSEVLGFVMEELPDRRMAVFVPISPTPTMGNVHIVAEDRVKLLDSAMDATQAISEWGIGTRRAIEGAPDEPLAPSMDRSE
jgi:uncharacterized membrane protein